MHCGKQLNSEGYDVDGFSECARTYAGAPSGGGNLYDWSHELDEDTASVVDDEE